MSQSVTTSGTAAVSSVSQTMSSLEIAKLTDKRHNDVLRDIRNTLAQAEIDAAQFCATLPYGNNGNTREVFNLPRLECDLVISGYSVKYRLAIIKRWHELEATLTTTQPSITTTDKTHAAIEAANAAAAQVHTAVFKAVMAGNESWKFQRWLVSFVSDSRHGAPAVVDKVEMDEFVMSLAYLATALAAPGGMMPTNLELANLASVCATKLAQRMQPAKATV